MKELRAAFHRSDVSSLHSDLSDYDYFYLMASSRPQEPSSVYDLQAALTQLQVKEDDAWKRRKSSISITETNTYATLCPAPSARKSASTRPAQDNAPTHNAGSSELSNGVESLQRFGNQRKCHHVTVEPLSTSQTPFRVEIGAQGGVFTRNVEDTTSFIRNELPTLPILQEDAYLEVRPRTPQVHNRTFGPGTRQMDQFEPATATGASWPKGSCPVGTTPATSQTGTTPVVSGHCLVTEQRRNEGSAEVGTNPGPRLERGNVPPTTVSTLGLNMSAQGGARQTWRSHHSHLLRGSQKQMWSA